MNAHIVDTFPLFSFISFHEALPGSLLYSPRSRLSLVGLLGLPEVDLYLAPLFMRMTSGMDL